MNFDHLKNAIFLTPLLLASAANAQSVTVKVGAGDTLAGIAQKNLGDGSRWREICKLNRDVIGQDCDVIQPGMMLDLPVAKAAAAPGKKPEPAEKTAAAAPAETPKKPEATPGSFTVDVSSEEGPVFRGLEPFKASHTPDSDFVTLSGNVPNASPTGHPGLWVAVSDAFEKEASGKKISITIVVDAKSAGEISAAYSTSDVGNSGWRSFSLTPGENTVSFEYAVPKMNKGNGDYLGILPDPKSTGQTVDVKSVTFDVLS